MTKKKQKQQNPPQKTNKKQKTKGLLKGGSVHLSIALGPDDIQRAGQ